MFKWTANAHDLRFVSFILMPVEHIQMERLGSSQSGNTPNSLILQVPNGKRSIFLSLEMTMRQKMAHA